MNFMAYGLPVVAAVREESEVARIVESAGAGWVSSSTDLDDFSATLDRILGDPGELSRRGRAGAAYAAQHFSPSRFADRFEAVLDDVRRG
jgi:glycosyltransferase involved in cell wall biosynthesis